MIKKLDASKGYFFSKEIMIQEVQYHIGSPVPDFILPHTVELFLNNRIVHESAKAIESVETEPEVAEVEIRSEGAGWYNVFMADMQLNPEKIRGKEAVEKWVTSQGLTYKYV
jgi:hypothetical protein